ncbi:hypothetical protein [Serpentinicella alkaliphila]|uniref:Holin family Hol44 protein (Superfamily V) n=1 Tax=Serpentinicella alkaliphila TaxID=1734049 RepID=A0A4V2T4B9_9FIRM|nr:hypothetical protein [Serpentinicella alkaliphila]QUH24568.1 hypothetical protein HZR23_01320 [Serpentinicella alkaliphila]TCQ04664.1 hypothetical protein EDD79_100668 [Serpentinicella alkaliphila]
MIEYNIPILISIIIGISSTLKRVFDHKYDRFEPLFKLSLGILAGVIYTNPHNIKLGILEGIIIGLAANGFNIYAQGIKNGYANIKMYRNNKR